MRKSGLNSRFMLGTATAALSLVLLSHPSHAQSLDDVMRRLDKLEKENADLKKQVGTRQRAAAPAQGAASTPVQAASAAPVAAIPSELAAAPVDQPPSHDGISQFFAADLPVKVSRSICGPNGHGFLERKPGDAITFYTCSGEITAYGNFNVSIDDTTKDLFTMAPSGGPGTFPGTGSPPIGNFSWMPAISTNISYLGTRGFERVGNYPFNFVYQFEVGIDISATPGLKQSNSQISDTTNGALFNRNTFIGLAGDYGAVKIGKSDSPYKNSTAQFNPFAGMLGDMAVIMGNTGGDNRVEFNTRLDHAIWYESPVVGGLQFNFMFQPGQNRDPDSGNIAAGESDCTGSNDPTSGGNVPVACNDGSWSNALSTNLSYSNGGLYATVAYERHFAVNRQSDITAIYGGNTGFGGAFPLGSTSTSGLTFPTAFAAHLYNEDIADEDAWKVGALYKFQTKTTIGGIVESFHRYVPADLEFQNERQRYGTWVFLSQELNQTDSVHFGWAHAFATPGDPGQHNDATIALIGPSGVAEPGAFFASNNNQADMLTTAFRRNLSSNLSWYTNVAATINGPSAHYDLGGGGRSVTTDCHDAFGATGGGLSPGAHCWTGATLMGVSTGVQWRF
ncbi:MAG: porin [Xanthobacteraceae bacterium]